MWKILVIDDNFANRQLLTEMLREHAICDVAVNGHEAIEAYRLAYEQKKPYDMILLDIEMPEMNGLEFLTIVRDLEKQTGILPGKGIPIIMVTAHKHPFMEAFNLGCDDYILKPVDMNNLLEKIENKLHEK